MIRLKEKVVLVTGGSKGIGAMICKVLADAGANIALTYNSSEKEAFHVAHVVASKGSSAVVIRADIANPLDIRRAVRTTIKEFGRIDILVNNAGIWKRGDIGRMTERQWDEMLDTNLKSAFLFSNEVVPHMKRQGGGKIINIASTAGQRGEPHYSHYAASKAGLIGFTKSIGAELAPFNIICNCIAPGWIDTDMTTDPLRKPMKRREILKIIPDGRIGTPEDIANAVLFLASDLSNHMVGSTISVNGGSVLV